jgi:hypothetical protein
MKRVLLGLCWLASAISLSSVGLAASGTLTLNPAAALDRGPTVVVGQKIQFRLESAIKDAQTASLNLTRAGRVVGEYPMRRDGSAWVARIALDLPYAYVATLRLFEGKRVWAAATDLYALEAQDAREVKPGSGVSNPLEFTVTEGRAGGDANPWWGIAAILLLVAGVFLGTQGLRRRARSVPPTSRGEST